MILLRKAYGSAAMGPDLTLPTGAKDSGTTTKANKTVCTLIMELKNAGMREFAVQGFPLCVLEECDLSPVSQINIYLSFPWF